MKTVAKIIESYGGLQWLRQPGNYIRLDNSPFMRLVIEHIGVGPRGMPSIAVAHYHELNGDAMRVISNSSLPLSQIGRNRRAHGVRTTPALAGDCRR